MAIKSKSDFIKYLISNSFTKDDPERISKIFTKRFLGDDESQFKTIGALSMETFVKMFEFPDDPTLAEVLFHQIDRDRPMSPVKLESDVAASNQAIVHENAMPLKVETNLTKRDLVRANFQLWKSDLETHFLLRERPSSRGSSVPVPDRDRIYLARLHLPDDVRQAFDNLKMDHEAKREWQGFLQYIEKFANSTKATQLQQAQREWHSFSQKSDETSWKCYNRLRNIANTIFNLGGPDYTLNDGVAIIERIRSPGVLRNNILVSSITGRIFESLEDFENFFLAQANLEDDAKKEAQKSIQALASHEESQKKNVAHKSTADEGKEFQRKGRHNGGKRGQNNASNNYQNRNENAYRGRNYNSKNSQYPQRQSSGAFQHKSYNHNRFNNNNFSSNI